MVVVKARLVPAGIDTTAIAKQCSAGPGVGVDTVVPDAVSAEAVRDGTHPPSTVSGPAAVMVTSIWALGCAVTTRLHPAGLDAVPRTCPGAGKAAGVGVEAIADGGWAAPEEASRATPQPPTASTTASRNAAESLMRVQRGTRRPGSRRRLGGPAASARAGAIVDSQGALMKSQAWRCHPGAMDGLDPTSEMPSLRDQAAGALCLAMASPIAGLLLPMVVAARYVAGVLARQLPVAAPAHRRQIAA